MKRQAYYILDPSVDQKQDGDEYFNHTWNWVRADPSVKLAEGFVYRRPIPDAPTPDDGWIPWGGGDRPVMKNIRVDVKFRNGLLHDSPAAHLRWDHRYPTDMDIIAYRIVKAPEPQWLPLTCDDVPPGSVIRWNETDAVEESLDGWCLIVAVGDDGVTHIQCGNTFSDTSWEALMPHDIKRPGEDWQPCKKPSK